MSNITIVDIPEKMQKFYGKGKMLNPDIAMVEKALRKIPYGKVAMIGSICDGMAQNHQVKVSCPMRTTHAIKMITEQYAMEDVKDATPFWRVVRNNHKLINSPYTKLCADLLAEEGFKLSESNGEVKVLAVPDRLYYFL